MNGGEVSSLGDDESNYIPNIVISDLVISCDCPCLTIHDRSGFVTVYGGPVATAKSPTMDPSPVMAPPIRPNSSRWERDWSVRGTGTASSDEASAISRRFSRDDASGRPGFDRHHASRHYSKRLHYTITALKTTAVVDTETQTVLDRHCTTNRCNDVQIGLHVNRRTTGQNNF